MVTQGEKVLGTYLLIESHELVGVPLLGLEQGNDILEAYLGRVTVVLHVVIILVGAFHIEAARHPVAGAFDALRPPVRPDAELDIAEPFGYLIVFQRLPRGLEFAGHHRLVLLGHGYLIILCRSNAG